MPTLAIRNDLKAEELRRLARRERDAGWAADGGDRQRTRWYEPRDGGQAGGHGPADVTRLGDPVQRVWCAESWRSLGCRPADGGG